MEKQILPRKEAEDTSIKTLPEMVSLSVSSYSKNYSLTQLESNQIDYTWEISDFTDIIKITNKLTSARFPETAEYNIQMNIYHTNQENIIGFYLFAKTEFLGLCNVSSIQLTKSLYVGSKNGYFKSSGTLLCEINEGLLDKYLYKDSLVLIFKFKTFHKARTNTIYVTIPSSNAIFSENEASEISSDSNSDDIKSIKIIINKESYILSKDQLRVTNSIYFKTLCNTKNEIDMTNDLTLNNELESFMDMLSFIKMGEIPFYISDVKDYIRLIKVAHKYDVRDLKLICERYLVDSITLENAVRIIQPAFLCDAKFLEKYALGFIKINMKKIAVSTEFRSLPQEYSQKIMKLIETCNIDITDLSLNL